MGTQVTMAFSVLPVLPVAGSGAGCGDDCEGRRAYFV